MLHEIPQIMLWFCQVYDTFYGLLFWYSVLFPLAPVSLLGFSFGFLDYGLCHCLFLRLLIIITCVSLCLPCVYLCIYVQPTHEWVTFF